ncbi:PEP-CTERM sorting domain-containing protein [Parasphingorhabdus halotolerans]|uniref:PEP-CTERM sorting domain-containing protein n=1 Tax=Parasphingorhabdus halotolerans TaxID=2725558 RepID=A0A6H2DM51_9SPHN|nr:PEP-CTERM sorting domain-containing protein [Parasphingorhabdus halotolerans]QJB68831.1 PEP-CTERM sorting domain-containing protein [Parasphingorhabdus halotolerans]
MNIAKSGILAGIGALTMGLAAPAEAAWYSNNRGTWNGGSSSGWGSSGWGSSGWGSSGWGSSGWGSSGGSSGSSGSTGGSTSSGGSSSGGSSSGGTQIPEPSNFMMLGLGVGGLVAGRLVARRRRKTA